MKMVVMVILPLELSIFQPIIIFLSRSCTFYFSFVCMCVHIRDDAVNENHKPAPPPQFIQNLVYSPTKIVVYLSKCIPEKYGTILGFLLWELLSKSNNAFQ